MQPLSPAFLFLLLLSLGLSLILISPLLAALRQRQMLLDNYRRITIPVGAGLLIVAVFLASLALGLAINYLYPLGELYGHGLLYSMIIIVVGLSLFGLIDDLFGDSQFRGFRDHFGQLFRGKLTSGALKALGGGAVAALATMAHSVFVWEWVLNVVLVSLFANTFNLLDLRPGRALKVFLILGGVMLVFSFNSSAWIFWAIALGPVLVLLRADLREELALGDVGSNTVGGIVGLTMVYNFSPVVKIAAVIGLVLIHWYGEKRSITVLIQRVSFLKHIDNFGRAYRE